MNASEEIFQAYWKAKGKAAYVERQEDAAALYGLNKRRVAAYKQTSDWIIVFEGKTFWAEVKQSENATRFPFANIKSHQLGRARMIIKAGGHYDFFLYSINNDQWFRVPGAVVATLTDEGHKSITWDDLKDHEWLSTPTR